MVPLSCCVLALAASGEPPRFAVVTADLAPQVGIVLHIGADGGVTLTEPAANIPPGQLVALRRVGLPKPAWPGDPQIVLAGGDRIPGTIEGGSGSRLLIRPACSDVGKAWAIPLSAVRAIWFVPPPDAEQIDRRTPADSRGDVIRFRNGDTATGTVDGFTPDGSMIRLAAEKGLPGRDIDTRGVAAVTFDPSLVRFRKPKGPYFRVTLRDGTRFSLSGATGDADELRGTTTFGETAAIPWREVAAVDVFQGKAVYLSELTPKRATTAGFNGPGWPWTPDRTVKGKPLMLTGPAGGCFDTGIGTHPHTELSYDLSGKYRHFEAIVGLDAETGRRGTAKVEIVADGKPIPVPGLEELRAGDPPVVVRADVTGRKELTLIVGFGSGGGVQADVNWADARLIE